MNMLTDRENDHLISNNRDVFLRDRKMKENRENRENRENKGERGASKVVFVGVSEMWELSLRYVCRCIPYTTKPIHTIYNIMYTC